jgi:zinc and cadmium transporter
MLIDGLILFAVAFAAGLLAFYVPKISNGRYKLALVFAGAYLFSITIIHILPDLFQQKTDGPSLAIFILGGFFLQQCLEFFSSGVEHGHIHKHTSGHAHKESSAIWVFLALGTHSLLEGSLLVHGYSAEAVHSNKTILWGILLHKAPEAFALMSVLLCELENKKKALIYLLLFSVASPAGLRVSRLLMDSNLISIQSFTYLFALVSGNFLHISTTILFESSTDHKFNAKKLGVALVAALVAVGAEIIL